MKHALGAVIVSIWMLGCFLSGCSATDDPITLYNTGADRYNEGQYAQAIGMFKWSLEKRREFSAPMVGLAKCHLRLAEQGVARNDYAAAFKDLEDGLYWINRAINVDPANPEAFHTKIAVLQQRGQAETSVATANRMGDQVGPSVGTLRMLAQTYRELGDYDNAETVLRQAVRIAPENVSAHVDLAGLLEDLDRKDRALRFYQRAYEIDPQYPGLSAKIAQLKDALGEESPMPSTAPSGSGGPE